MRRLLTATAIATAMTLTQANATVFEFDGTGSGMAIDAPTNVGNVTTAGCGTVGSDLCTINNAEGFIYSEDGITFTAFGLTGGSVMGDNFVSGTAVGAVLIQDLVGVNQGLGVVSDDEPGNLAFTSTDQINGSFGESILLTFMNQVSITDIFLNDGTGNDCPGGGAEGPCGDIGIIVDGGAIQTFTDFLAMGIVAAGGGALTLSGTTFEFISLSAEGGYSIEGFSVVPIPGAIPLLLSGLAGLSFASRGKKKKA